MSDLSKELKYLPGAGPKRAELLASELKLYTLRDMLFYFPYKHIDRTKLYYINEISGELPYIQLKGKIVSFNTVGEGYKTRLTAVFTDGTGYLELIWFHGTKWVKQTYKEGVEYLIFGKPTWFNSRVSIAHPEIEEISKHEQGIKSALQAIYSTTEKLKSNFITTRTIQKLISIVVRDNLKAINESFPSYLIDNLKLLPLHDAIYNIHFPQSIELLRKAEFRLKFEELFFIQLNMLKNKAIRSTTTKGFVFEKVGTSFNTFYHNNLTFELTDDQKKVVKEIRRDMGSGKQLNRLLQGDVGSGKTLVALMCMLLAIDNNFQTCLMAPTEILAHQHFVSISKFLDGIEVRIKLLTGSTKKKEREEIATGLLDGSINILIGTHALIEDNVAFQNLGLAIIDEQHRFGVAQRAMLQQKNSQPPHILVMTATPIPRTLAMTVYGDLDQSVIEQMPPGRKPIKTSHYFNTKRPMLIEFMKKEIALGRQIYVVYPLISESEKFDYKTLEEGYEQICKSFPAPQYKVAMVHGKMKPAEKEAAMLEFKERRAQILVATTVIEVGVDVPNASVMVIESAERFGLSQLHQLRGRVGRGAEQSYCILITDFKLSDFGRKRMAIMTETSNGFKIAEQDLKMRGPGDIESTQQSGLPLDLHIANLAQDGQILSHARNVASDIISDDPSLTKPENSILLQQLTIMKKKQFEWRNVG